MVDVGVDEKALTHLLEKVLVADTHAPVTLALEKAGVRTASDLVSLKLHPDVPLKYDKTAEGGDKVKKNIPLLQAEMRQIIGIQEYIQYYSKSVSHKFFESLDDWEELTAKNFISFRINIAPFLPPDVTPPAVVTQPSPATSDPLRDWEKGVKPDMSIFRELKNVKEWDQWDTHGANGGIAGADEWETLPHIHWTRNLDWDPAIFNHKVGDNDDEWDDPVMDYRDLFDKVGNYRNRQGIDTGEVHSSRQIEVAIS